MVDKELQIWENTDEVLQKWDHCENKNIEIKVQIKRSYPH